MIYNFRHDRSKTKEICKRIRINGVVSQGWGGGENGGLDLRENDFVGRTCRLYDLKTTNVATNLSRMRDFKDGDVLVLPHLPTYGTVSLHIVDGNFGDCYEYEQSDPTHQNHRISVSRSFGLDGEIVMRNVGLRAYHARLRYLRLPVLRIPDLENAFKEIMSAMELDTNAQFAASGLDDFLEKAAGEVADRVAMQMRAILPSGAGISFERVCERILVENGYEVVARNQFDGRGADADVVCTRSRSDLSSFETGDIMLYVQIKKHRGETGVKAVNQVINKLQSDPNADGCVMSAADGFTNPARNLAEQHGIALLNNMEICRLLLPLLSRYLPSE